MSKDRIDPDAEFTAFAEGCQLRMVRAAYLMCGDRHVAEDVVQGALVKVALRWRRLREGQPEAYLRTVVYRDAISWWRRHRREVPVADLPDRGGGDDGTRASNVRIMFANALARLTHKQRAVLVLRFFEDNTEARTAEILGIAIGTVKSQTTVALRRLRELAPELAELVGQGDGRPESGRRDHEGV